MKKFIIKNSIKIILLAGSMFSYTMNPMQIESAITTITRELCTKELEKQLTKEDIENYTLQIKALQLEDPAVLTDFAFPLCEGPLTYATQKECAKIVELFLNLGACPNPNDGFVRSSLRQAVFTNKSTAVITLLLQNGGHCELYSSKYLNERFPNNAEVVANSNFVRKYKNLKKDITKKLYLREIGKKS